MTKPLRDHGVEGHAVTQCGEHVVHQPAAAIDVAAILRHQPRHAGAFGQRDQCAGECGFVAPGLVTLHFHGDAALEDFAPLMQQPCRFEDAILLHQGRQGA